MSVTGPNTPITARIQFPGNPWPEGHAVIELIWTARVESGFVWFDIHVRSADYGAERQIPDDPVVTDDWHSPSLWVNFGACILSSSYWTAEGRGKGFCVCPIDGYLKDDWIGREFHVDPLDDDDFDLDTPSFDIYLLGHDSVAGHRIRFSRRTGTDLLDLHWTGAIALTYAGETEFEHDFQVEAHGLTIPSLQSGKVA